MDVATMIALNNMNMLTALTVQAANNVITIVNGERMEEDMDGSMLDQYMGKDCTVSLFNEIEQSKESSWKRICSGERLIPGREHSLLTEI